MNVWFTHLCKKKLLVMGTILNKISPFKVLFFFLITLLSVQSNAQNVKLIEESTVTDEGLYFWYPNGEKAFHYAPSISPRGDCFTVVNGYVFFGWYKGGMRNRDLMISRKKIGSGKWVTVQLPHKNTLIGAGNKWGDSHKTISVGVSKIDGTVHIFYDHHNDPLKYIVSKKNIAFAPDSQFKRANFERTRENLAPGQKVRMTYPKITHNEMGEIILNYRAGAAVGGNEIVNVYNGDQWTRSKQITDGRPGRLADNPNRVGWNYAYGVPYYNNGDVYYAFSVRWAEKKSQGILNEGVYLAKTGPKFTDKWEDLNGNKHDLPIVDFSPFLVANPPSHNGKGSSGGTGVVVSENGDVHITYDGRGPGTTHHYTYTRKAGEKEFVRHDGIRRTGLSWNNRFYTINGSNSGKITISSGEPGTINYRSELVLETGKKFRATSSYLNDGKLVLIASELKQSDKIEIYCYVFELPTNDNNNPQAPSVTITSPTEGAEFEVGETIMLKANASDPDGDLEKVNFKINDGFYKTVTARPFEHTFVPTEAGTYKIGALAIDKENAKKEVFVTIKVVEKNNPPVAFFSTPTKNVFEEGYSKLLVTVDASDTDGDDLRVLLKIDGQEIRQESVAPYEWGHSSSPNSSETLNLTVGEHVLQAVVTDEKGASTTVSKTVTITPRLITSSYSKVEQSSLSAFPNPSKSGVFELSTSEKWEVYNNQAQLITVGEGKKIDLSNEPNGVYILKSKQKNIKLVK